MCAYHLRDTPTAACLGDRTALYGSADRATLTFLAYGFLALERHRENETPAEQTKNPTDLPPFRRAGPRRPRVRRDG